MTDQTHLLRFANTCLLLVIAIILLLILRTMPRPTPNSADFELARSHHDIRKLQSLRSQLPAVAVENEVEITGDVGFSDPFLTIGGSVSIDGPVSVEANKPNSLSVTISNIALPGNVQLPVEVKDSTPIVIDSTQPVQVQIVR